MNFNDIKLSVDPQEMISSALYPIEHDRYSMFLQEIEMLFNTSKHDVLCEPNMWPNIKAYVFSTGISSITLSSVLNDLISQYCPTSEFCEWDLDVKFMRGELSDIGIIDLVIYVKEDGREDITRQFYIG